jgi:Acetyltransferase (GNAT) domain
VPPTAENGLSYRLAEADDLPGVLELWKEDSGWGEMPEEIWRGWFSERPYGPSSVVIGVDRDEAVAAEMIFTPCRLHLGEREVDGLQISAPVVRRDYRHRELGPQHPVVSMFFLMRATAHDLGCSIFYAVPHRAWVPFFKTVPATLGQPFLASAPRGYKLARAALDAAPQSPYRASPAAGRAAEYEQLWQAARAAWPLEMGVVRGAGWVDFQRRWHLTLDVRDGSGGLVGYCAVRERDWLIADVLCRSPADAPELLRAALRALPAEAEVVKAMGCALLEPALVSAGFDPDRFWFGFACTSIDPAIALENLAPEQWWVGPIG